MVQIFLLPNSALRLTPGMFARNSSISQRAWYTHHRNGLSRCVQLLLGSAEQVLQPILAFAFLAISASLLPINLTNVVKSLLLIASRISLDFMISMLYFPSSIF